MQLKHAGMLTLVIALLPAAVGAQPRMPAEGTVALGGDIGVFVPQEDLETSLTLAGFAEFYMTPRVSVRGTLGWANPDFETIPGSLRQVRLVGNLLYNWERVEWHPFVTAGAGAYFVQPRRGGDPLDDTETKAGFNLGGGIEYFTSRTLSIKGEGLYHIISHEDFEANPSGLTLTIGLKKYY